MGVNFLKTILITGAAGDVGTHLRRELAGKYILKVSDLRSLKKINKEEQFVRADISKFSDARRITKGVDAVVHMGGYSVEGPWEGILNANIIASQIFEAAASTAQAILFPPRHATVSRRSDNRPPRLSSPTAAMASEGLVKRSALVPDRRHAGVLHCIGNVTRCLSTSGGCDLVVTRTWRNLSPWHCASKIRFELVYGVSRTRAVVDNSNAYRPATSRRTIRSVTRRR